MAETKGVSKIRVSVVSLTAVFLFILLAVVLNILFDNAPFIIPTLTSVALVVVTAALVYFTRGYSIAANSLVEAQNNQVKATCSQVTASNELVAATSNHVQVQKEQVEATNKQVAALTNPILYVDICVIERPIQNLVGVPMPQALEVFIQNVGPGNACDIILDVKDDFTFLAGNSVQWFKREIIKNSVTRLAPGQRRTLLIIVLGENPAIRKGTEDQIAKHEIALSYKNALTRKQFDDSFMLDFTYYFELIKRLSNIGYTSITTSDSSDVQKMIESMKRDRKRSPATYTLNLTQKEKDFIDRIYDSVGGTVTQWVMDDTLRTLATEAGLSEQEPNDYSRLFRDSGLAEVEIFHGGGIAMLKLTAYGVHYVRGLKTK
jgi:hypothetical protein